MSSITRVSRRDFLRIGGGAAGAVLVLGCDLAALARNSTAQLEPNAFVSLDSSGTIRIWIHRSNMGQDIRTACATMVAEELEVGLDQVEIVQAPGDARFGDQNTDGSRSVRTQYLPLRRAGASAREMLKQAAADQWSVSPESCDAERGRVHHRRSGQSTDYADLVESASALPVPEDPPLKDPSDFDLIGTRQTGLDVPDIVTGRARFGADVKIGGMRYASLERSPTRSGRALNWNDEAALAVPGVLRVIDLPATPLTNAAVAVVAENTWAALQGRRVLDVSWAPGDGPSETSETFRSEIERVGSSPGRVVREEGDFDVAESEADRVIEARYHGPYLAHAPMEPMAVLASVTPDFCEVWAPTQAPQWARQAAAQAAGLRESQTQVHVTLLGGGFGRKSKPDFVIEAVGLARRLGEPVRIQWTREDEIRHGFYRAENHQHLKAALDGRGRITGWYHKSTFPAIGSTFDPSNRSANEAELDQGLINMPYRIPNVHMEHGEIASAFRVGWLRSVCNTFHARAVNCFMDELAYELGRDPVDFHLEMLGEPRLIEVTEAHRRNPYKFDTRRLTAVIERVRTESEWDRRALQPGEGWGFAAHYSFNTFVATVAKVWVTDGRARVNEVHQAVDVGTVVNPDTIDAQVEGATVFGLSYALYGRITAENGAIVQSNFHDYPLLRIGEMPAVHVHQIENDAMPTGIGEPGVPPVAPAVLNAVFAATGKRIYDTPLAGQDLTPQTRPG